MTTRPGGHLPAPLNSFVGRADSTRAVGGLLDVARLVTLTGPGGVGKSRLAQETALALEAGGRRICWVDLGPLGDPDLIGLRVAQVLGVRHVPGERIETTLARMVADRPQLLVLDTCEHLLPAAARLVDELLRSSRRCSVLATSREPLRVDGEATWAVPPLGVPAGSSAADVLASEAGRLFVERARRAAPSFHLTADNAHAVAETCRRLDGLPLAIELAAARCRALSAERIAKGLDDRFRLLGRNGQVAADRHRTLRASMEWSYALLTAPERALLRALGVFAGWFTLEGAAAVAPACGVPAREVLDLLVSLVERSLVVADTVPPEPRYRLLDSVRAFAIELQSEHGQGDAIAELHSCYVADLVRRRAPQLVGTTSAETLAELDLAADDARQALSWMAAAGRESDALQLTTDLHWYWRVRGPEEGRARTASLLDAADPAGAARAPALITLSSLEMMLGRLCEASRHAAEARDLAERRGDQLTLGRALAFLGWLSIMQERDLARPALVLEDAVATCGASGDAPYEALAHNALGFSLVGLPPGRRMARVHLERGMALARELRFERPLVEGELWLALLELVEGELQRSADRLERLLLPEPWPWEPLFHAIATSTLAEVRVYAGEYASAEHVIAGGLRHAAEAREQVGEAYLRRASGLLAYARGELDDAYVALREAADVLAPAFVREATRCEELLAVVALLRGDADAALSLAERCPVQARTFPYIRATAPALQALALAHQAIGEPAVAAEVCHELLDASVEVGHLTGACDALDGLAASLAVLGRAQDAARVLGLVDAQRERIGYVRFPVDRPRYDAAVERVSATLDEAAFAVLVAGAAGLDWDEGVALVRRGRGPRGRPAHGWHSLTPTEHEVVALVTQGLTNRQIGNRLFVSPRTVQSHLRHVFAKLDVANRAELAAVASARTTPDPRERGRGCHAR